MRMKSQVDFDLIARGLLLPQLVVDPRQRHVRLGVGSVKTRRIFQLVQCGFRFLLILQHRSQLKVRLRKSRVQPDCLAQILFRLGRPVQKLLRDGQVQIRPRRWMLRSPIERDGFLVVRNRQVVLVLVVVAKPQVVVGAPHARIECDGLLKVVDGAVVFMPVVVQPPQPVGVKRRLVIVRGQRFEHRARPIRMADPDVGHGLREAQSGVERCNRFRLFPRNGGVHVVLIEKVDCTCKSQQMRGSCRMGIAADLGQQQLFRCNVIPRVDRLLQLLRSLGSQLQRSHRRRLGQRGLGRGFVGGRLRLQRQAGKAKRRHGHHRQAWRLAVDSHHGE